MIPFETSPAVLAGLAALFGALAVLCAAFALNRHRAYLAVRESERSFRDLYDNISEGVFRSTLDGHMISANPALVRLNGFSSEADMLDEVNDIAGQWYVDPNRRAEIHRMLEEQGQVINLVSEVYRYKSRERIWIEESTRLVRDKVTGRPRYYDGTVREVTDTVRRNQLQDRYDRITKLVLGCFYQMQMTPDGKARITYISPGVTRMYGVQPEEAMEDPSILSALIHPDDSQRVRQSFIDAMREFRPRQDEYRIRAIDGTERWIFGHSVPERMPDGLILWHGYFVDISIRKRAQAQVYDLAYRDTLTGLPNRAAFVNNARETLAAGDASQRWCALLYIDLDQFKVLNDTKGHHFGDRLLCAVAERLRPVVGAEDHVARLGGDEFVVMVKDVGRNQAAAELQVGRVVDRVHAVIRDPFVLDGFPFHTSASIGVALTLGSTVGVDDLLKQADVAMYEAKASSRGSMCIFAPQMQTALEEQLALTMELRDALEAGSLTIAYQPQVDDAGACFGVEALLRWNHRERGAISPTTFIPLAERAGLGGQIDAFVLAMACSTLHRWRNMPVLRSLHLSVNVGSRRLDRGVVALVSEAVRAHGVDATRLTIEITERVMLDNLSEVDFALAALKNLGVRIALDDFGTGYSSLSHLKRLPIDTLKIDRSFVNEIETDANDRVIVQTILNIARNLGVSAIAEGVETEMQALLLRRFGCHAYQGFMYGRPMDLDQFEAYVVAGVATSAAVLPPSLKVV
jgi:diguanylate cyclase (GGDEF)-like protein/PAS domain S-box-containing protein